MTETSEIRTFIIAQNRPNKEALTPAEKKAKNRIARMKFIERCRSGEYMPRPYKEEDKLTIEEKLKIRTAKTKITNLRFRQNNREAVNAYMNAKKIKHKYKNNEEHRNREKEKSRIRYRRKRELKLSENAAVVAKVNFDKIDNQL